MWTFFPFGDKHHGSDCREFTCNFLQEIQFQSLGQEDPLEDGMATHSSIFALKTPGTEEPGRYSPYVSKESDTTKHEPMPYNVLEVLI